MNLNRNFFNLEESYLFSNVAKKVARFKEENPNADIIKLGIGDVTLPLCTAVVDELQKAVLEMGQKESFRGYGPEQGYDFLREKIKGYYNQKGVDLEIEEIFISDGAKSDIANILDIFDKDNSVVIPDPVYPVYVDTNLMAGRRIEYLNANEENDFLPLPEKDLKGSIIYLCSPNNPTGSAYDRKQLKQWVDFAIENSAVILFDAAYEAFIEDEKLPRSIFEIDGAKKCAIEFCSFSKMAGFTGTRCGYTVVPMELEFGGAKLNRLWLRRQTTKFNGVPYIVQRGAAAVFSEEGMKQIKESLSYYKENARIISRALEELKIYYTGGKNSPYIWLKCPNDMESWEFFDYLLKKANVVGTPGSGFGKNGEGFFRLTAFGDRQNTIEAIRRISNLSF